MFRYTRLDNFEEFRRLTSVEFVNRSLSSYINLLFGVVGFSPNLIRICSTHTVHLGLCEWVNAGAFLELVDDQFWGASSQINMF